MPQPPSVLGRAAPGTGALLGRHGRDPHALVQILRELQAVHGWLPRQALADIAAGLGLSLAHVQGVAGFYRFLHTQPVGEYRILFSDNVTDRMLGMPGADGRPVPPPGRSARPCRRGRPGQRGLQLLHRPGSPGPGTADQPPPGPVLPQVAAACELLGLDPLYIANEGKLVAIVAPEAADAALAALRK